MLRNSSPATLRRTASKARTLAAAVLGPTFVIGAGAVAVQTAGDSGGEVPAGFERVYFDGQGPNGELTGGSVIEPAVLDPHSIPVTPAPMTTLFRGQSLAAGGSQMRQLGGGDNRVDLVFVGDGYTAAQQGTYQNHVNNVVGGVFGSEPLTSYIDYFTVHRIDVVSNESGVDNDPSQGIQRDTALDMQFWCNNIERLLCVSVSKAYSFANNAPDVDQVIALANTTKYGGAGYTSNNLATSSGGNGAAVEIVKHELGHSLGNLADEYTYGGPDTYTGGEPSRQNVSIQNEATMASTGDKWANWLGTSVSGFDGTIGTFEGAQYSVNGIYRPSNNSLMRALNRDFNLVGAEQIIKELYREVEPIDAASDPALDYRDTEILSVSPMNVVGAPLSVQWFLDGAAIPGATSSTLDLSTLGLLGCVAEVSVTVRDETPWVRDESFRDANMTQSLTYRVNEVWTSEVCATTPNSVTSGALIGLTGSPSLSDEDLVVSVIGGPPLAPSLLFYASTPVVQPMGAGTLCASGLAQRYKLVFFDNLGTASHRIDFAVDPVSSGSTALLPGTTWIFQAWFRDSDGMGGATYDFSNAVSATFCQ